MDIKPTILASSSRLRIIVLGYIVRGPLGGLVWHHLQYALGLHLMGHDILFVEDSDDTPTCYNPETYEMTTDPAYGLSFIQKSFEPYGLGEKWAYYDAHTNTWHGRTREQTLDFLSNADLLLNLSGTNVLRDWLLDIPVRILVDTDPAFTQIRNLTEPGFRARTTQHNAFFTFGENFGRPDCSIPDDGIPWKATRQPIVPEVWPLATGHPGAKWTTVMQWDSYKTRDFEGRFFGMKSASFDTYRDLPRLAPDIFEIALGSDGAPGAELSAAGWHITDPLAVTKTPWTYQQYIRQSKGEWSIAKHGYVVCNSGWFSERSAAYLVSGRPVVVQDTGFTRLFDSENRGLLAFTDLQGAIAALEAVDKDYQAHCTAARSIAAACFNYKNVLRKLINTAFNFTEINP